MFTNWFKKGLVFLAAAVAAVGMLSAEGVQESGYSIAVFIPGVVAGSPTYEMLVSGVEKAAAEREGTSVKVVEGGFNQGEWINGLTELASTAQYDLIVSTNPAIPELCAKVSESFPQQKFLLLDGYIKGYNNISAVRFNQMEQAFLAGHLAGLITVSQMEGVNQQNKVGFIAAQEYPDMNMAIRPGYELGVNTALQDSQVDFRVVGNWYDAARAEELASSMIKSGVDVMLVIAGGAAQGVLAASEKAGTYVIWYDSNGYSISPGVIAGSTQILLDKKTYEKTLEAIDGHLEYGITEVVGVKEGYVGFISDDPLFKETVTPAVAQKQLDLVKKMKTGELHLPMPIIE